MGVNAVSISSGHHRTRSSGTTSVRLDVARVLGIAGVVAYNWWVIAPFIPGLMTSPNEFFSDLEASGRPDAELMQHADLLAGLLLVAALLVRGAAGRNGARREWKWLVAFAAAGAVGGRFPYACSEGLSASCRRLEWHLQLPVSHYIHVLSGMAEFLCLTVALVLAVGRTEGETTREAHAFRILLKGLIIGYPLLGVAYLTDSGGVFIEPIFFVIFSAMIIEALFEPMATGPRARRMDKNLKTGPRAEKKILRTTGIVRS